MVVITKQKVADYIKQYPEAATLLLLWFKEFFPYIRKRQITQPATGILNGSANLGRGTHVVQYLENPWLEAAYITWFGTVEEIEAKYNAGHPNAEQTVKTVTILLSPGTSNGNQTDKGNYQTNKKVNLPYFDEGDIAALVTPLDYEIALNRAIAIFGSKPDTPDFKELYLLVRQISKYEQTNIELPKLSRLEVIRKMVNERELIPAYLAFMIKEDEETIRQMLDGEMPLSDKIFKKLARRFNTPY